MHQLFLIMLIKNDNFELTFGKFVFIFHTKCYKMIVQRVQVYVIQSFRLQTKIFIYCFNALTFWMFCCTIFFITVLLFTDVMSFVGFLNIHPLTVYERTVYNMMNEKSLSILNVVKDLQTIHDSILSDIQLIVPEVVIIKVNPDFVER